MPHDHFYRHLNRLLDLSFVRDLAADCYAAGGRPSIDPVVFFRLQLIMFFAGIRSERQLMEQVGYNLAIAGTLATTSMSRCPIIPAESDP